MTESPETSHTVASEAPGAFRARAAANIIPATTSR